MMMISANKGLLTTTTFLLVVFFSLVYSFIVSFLFTITTTEFLSTLCAASLGWKEKLTR